MLLFLRMIQDLIGNDFNIIIVNTAIIRYTKPVSKNSRECYSHSCNHDLSSYVFLA